MQSNPINTSQKLVSTTHQPFSIDNEQKIIINIEKKMYPITNNK